jgi:TolB-like protein/Tfp pilus assembly protein PilF
MKVLCVLAKQPDMVISRTELIDKVWDVESGADEGLTRAISILRKTFRKAGEQKAYIETIHTRGYRLAVPVSNEIPTQIVHSQVAAPNTRPQEITLSVLPFADMSENGDQEYFSDGISDEIINALVRLPFLKVSGRTSSFSFKGKNTGIPEIAAALNVSHVLEGSVRKQGDCLRITAQLIEATQDYHLWSKTFDGTMDDIFDLQDKIARKIEQELESIFDVETVPGRLASTLTKNRDAYDLFLQGRNLAYQSNGQTTLPRAIELFEQAVAKDPDFIEAWAWLAIANINVPEYSRTPNWADNIVAARAATQRALALNPDYIYALRARAALLTYDLKLDEAVEIYEYAYKLDPNDPQIIFMYGYILAAIGLHEKADVLIQKALEREPLLGSWFAAWETVQFTTGQLEAAEEQFKKAFEYQFGGGPAFLLAQLKTHMGKTDEGLSFLRDNLAGMGPVYQELLKSPIVRKLIYAAFFKKSKAARFLVDFKLTQQMNDTRSQPTTVSIVGLLLIGRPRKFMRHIIEKPNMYVGYVLSRIWDPSDEATSVRTHPYFPEFAEKVGLVKAWQKYGWPNKITPIPGTDGSNGQFTCS